MIAELPRLRVAFEDEGQGPAIVLLHSLATDRTMWDGVAPLLVGGGFRVIRPDLRGHGSSARLAGPYSLEDFADDLAGLLDHLEVATPHVVGLSLGGMIAQAFALRHPGRAHSLVLADTTAEYPAAGRAIMEERAALAEREGMAPVVEPTIGRWFTEGFAASRPAVVDRYRSLIRSNDPLAYAASARAVASVAYRDRLGDVKTPALVIVGEHDLATPPELAAELAQGLSGAELVRVPGAHLSAVEAPEPFAATVLAFLRAMAETSWTSWP